MLVLIQPPVVSTRRPQIEVENVAEFIQVDFNLELAMVRESVALIRRLMLQLDYNVVQMGKFCRVVPKLMKNLAFSEKFNFE